MDDDNQVHNISNQIDKLNFSATVGRVPRAEYNLGNDNNVKDGTIKTLKRRIKVLQKNIDDQNKKLSMQDNLYVEYNSLSKNYGEIEYVLNQYKIENNALKEKLASKDAMLTEYQKLFEIGTSKFKMYEETNSALKLQNDEKDTQLRILPALTAKNEELSKKLKEYECKIENLKNEFEKKEELYKVKINSVERKSKLSSKEVEDEIIDLKATIEKLKVENEKLKKQLNLANDSIQEKEEFFKKELSKKGKEIQDLNKSIKRAQEEMEERNQNQREKIALSQKNIEGLKDEIKKLAEELNEKKDEVNRLNSDLIEYDNMTNKSEKELKSREAMICNLQKEKEKLENQLNDKQIDFVEYQNSSQQEISILNKKLIMIDNERTSLINQNKIYLDEIEGLKAQMSDYEKNKTLHIKECKTIDKKYNELVQALNLKEDELTQERQRYTTIIKKNQNEIEELKNKYEKKVQMQKLKINELNTRNENLINYFIGLKDYAMSIERNLNDTSNMNHSMMVSNPFAQNFTNTGRSDNAYSRKLLNEMKEMFAKIDSKLLGSNAGLNNTYTYSSY